MAENNDLATVEASKPKIYKPGGFALIRDIVTGYLLIGDYLTGQKALDGECGVPSGGVEEGETPEEAIIRESWEEARITIRLLRGYSYELMCPRHDVPLYGAIAHITNGTPTDTVEMRRHLWTHPEHALYLPHLSPRTRLMTQVALPDFYKLGIRDPD